MSGKEKPGVTRRLNRGRSAPDSKAKTDSGCFVDEELERNGSSDSSQGSINSSPVKDSKKAKIAHKESKANTDTALVLSSEPAAVEENASKDHGDDKEHVMNEDIRTNDKNETSVTENVDTACDVVEKTRRASDFYCLYYSASPEGTLTKNDAVKLRRKPPVPPKPKLRRGSAPPSSFNHIEGICNQNQDITKRFSYNEGQSDSSKIDEIHLSKPEWEKRKSVEERILFFEACAKDDLVKSTLFKNAQAANFKDSSDDGSKDFEIQNPSGSYYIQNGLDDAEKIAPLADNEEFSFESDSYNCESVTFDQEVHMPDMFVPLAEEDEFSINGSHFYQSSINCSTVSENCHSSENGRKCLDCLNEVDEIEDPEHFVVDENQNGVQNDFHYNEQQCSDPVTSKIYGESVTNAQSKDSHYLAPLSGMECFEVLTKEGDLLAVKTPSCNSDNCSSMPDLNNGQGTGFSEKLVNPRLNEIKQELLISSRRNEGNNKQRRPGSIAGLSNLEKDVTSAQLKRRSWSFSETAHPMDVNSPFVRKVYQVPSPKLTTSSWHSESGLSSPFVRSVQQNQPIQSTPMGINLSQRKLGRSGRPQSGASYLDYSGYTSDDSSVHSEPLFQPLRRRPQSLNSGRILKSMSDDSNISLLDNGDHSSSKVQRRRFRHSLGSRDPIFALRRQSVEFAEEEQPPTFRPVSPVQLPHIQTLKRASSYTSSSSDSEVERIFKQPVGSTSRFHRHTNGNIHDGLVSTVTHRKVSAMEALFGPQSTSSIAPSSDSEQSRRKTLSERFSEIPPQSTEEDFFSEELGEEELTEAVDEVVPKEIEEPRLEFDDTDYSEFYTRCEDKESIITAEAMSIKKLLQSPQTVLPDPDIETVVKSVTERRVSLSSLDKEETLETENVLCENDSDSVEETTSELEMAEQFYRRHRGTQTPPPEVFKALSPPPSVATQTPPVPVSQELPTTSLLKQLELQILTPTITRSLSPPTCTSQSHEQHSPLLEHFGAVSPPSAPIPNTDMLSPLQEADKAVSVEELLQILAGMHVGPPKETPSRKPVSVQKYNCPSPQNDNTKPSKIPKSLPSSWQHLSSPTGKQNNSESFKKPNGVPPRSSKSYDCLRRGLSGREKRKDVIQAKMVRCNGSSEDIRKKLKEWKLRSQLFEEEVECLEDKDDRGKQPRPKEGKALKVSYDGSECTDNIETQSKLTNTHSLKRPRKDRAFSQKERNGSEASSFEKQSLSLTTSKHDSLKSKDAKDSDDGVKKLFSSYGEEESKLELTSSEVRFLNNDPLHEVASPEGLDVFIDYRKKNGMHITSTPKPPPDPDKSVFDREDRVGKINLDKLDDVQSEKPVGASTAEDKVVLTDTESQGDASSSSYSSDDDHFGEFGGSTETVVFVDTEPNPEVSLEADLESLDMNFIGGDKLLSVNNNDDDEKDESRLDALLGEVRRSLNLEFVDSDILDKAIDRFKQRVSPKTQNKALCGGLSMEAYVALHQADELQGIIGEIKGELKLLHDENDMLREQVVSLANYQTNGEVTENSSTESSERLENLCKLYKIKHADTDDEEAVEIDVCLRGFSTVPLGHLPSKKKDIHLGIVTVKGADWNGVMEAARKTFVGHMKKIDPEDYLCLGAHSIQGVQTGVVVWSPGSLKRSSPRVELSNKSNPCVIQLKDGSHFSCDSLVYDTLLPKEAIENYVEQLLEHRSIVLCGQQGLGKSYLAAKLAEHVVQRIGWKSSPAVVTFNVTQQTRKELKRDLASLMQNSMSGSKDGIPAVIVLDQLNCLASLADIFDLSQLEKNSSCPYIIGVRDKSRKGPFSSKELSLCHYFRWLRVSVNDRQYSGLLGRFLRRKLSWSQIKTDVESDDLLELFDWLSKVWYHLNELLEDFCDSDATIGPSLFFSCPMDYKAAEGWFVNVWNYNVIPYLHQALRSGRKIFDRCASWEDPTKWVVLRYPWNKDHSRVLHTLRKLRQVDVVLNRNQHGSDNGRARSKAKNR
ncbi:uncharacterized protein LOC144643901 isoform X2 [Oculina patagonica]